jgi:hypothetical protein
MAMNRVQFQPGLSMPEFMDRLGVKSRLFVNAFDE